MNILVNFHTFTNEIRIAVANRSILQRNLLNSPKNKWSEQRKSQWAARN